MTPEDQRLWSTLVHVGGIFIGFWSPLIGYLVLKDRGGFVRSHAAAALNFQLTMLIAIIVGYVLCIILIGFLVLLAIAIVMLVFSIMAAMAANSGQPYTYPLSIQFVR
jgi:uncharacterized Tic20 family protein